MEIRYAKGTTSKQARTGWPAGTFEDELGQQGFAGQASMLYRAKPPTRWTRIEGDLKPRLANGLEVVPTDQNDPAGVPQLLLHNEDIHLSVSRRSAPMPYIMRNADGDEIYFVHQGAGILDSDFGPLTYEPGDYLVIPKATNYRVISTEPSYFFIIESRRGPVGFPERGVLGQHIPFDFALLESPEPAPHLDEDGEHEVRIKRGDRWTSVYYDFCPLDAVGWTGNLSTYKLNIRHLRAPSSDRTHLPPSAYATFKCPGAWIVTFQPRPFETDPDAMRVPGYHRNVDYDEVIFTHSGRLMSRAEGQGGATLTLHPAGIHHGPNPRAFDAVKEVERMEAFLVNVDSEKPFERTHAFSAAEDANYWASFSDQLLHQAP